jgi:hypothetical protein
MSNRPFTQKEMAKGPGLLEQFHSFRGAEVFSHFLDLCSAGQTSTAVAELHILCQ